MIYDMKVGAVTGNIYAVSPTNNDDTFNPGFIVYSQNPTTGLVNWSTIIEVEWLLLNEFIIDDAEENIYVFPTDSTGIHVYHFDTE